MKVGFVSGSSVCALRNVKGVTPSVPLKCDINNVPIFLVVHVL